MGRGAGESSTKVGIEAETFYDTQAFQYGVRDKWGFSPHTPDEDKAGNVIYAVTPERGCYIKPWEQGGHPHDFYRASRSTRSTDPYAHYEQGKALERHERLVAEVDAWRRREILKEDMIMQMSKLQAIERQRAHSIELRRQIHLEQMQWSRPQTARSAGSSLHSSRAGSADGEQTYRPGSVNLSTQANALRAPRYSHAVNPCSRQSLGNYSTAPSSARSSKAEEMPPIRIVNPSSAAAKLELQDLDTFEERLESMQAPPQAARSRRG